MRSDEIRNNAQNKKFHAMVRDVSRQLTWADGQMDEEDWKRLFVAALCGQKTVPNPFDPHAPFIVVNKKRTRQMEKMTMADLITLIQVFGDERGIVWTDERAAA